jgi:hypothetical protein
MSDAYGSTVEVGSRVMVMADAVCGGHGWVREIRGGQALVDNGIRAGGFEDWRAWCSPDELLLIPGNR